MAIDTDTGQPEGVKSGPDWEITKEKHEKGNFFNLAFTSGQPIDSAIVFRTVATILGHAYPGSDEMPVFYRTLVRDPVLNTYLPTSVVQGFADIKELARDMRREGVVMDTSFELEWSDPQTQAPAVFRFKQATPGNIPGSYADAGLGILVSSEAELPFDPAVALRQVAEMHQPVPEDAPV